ncbi:MAG TPA: choice-of-anchor Q domain-containing protein [Candidatus Binataceae bacterium]
MIGKRKCLPLCALTAALLGLFVGSTAFAATITVNSLADPGQVGVCALRDAITAANTKTATNACAAGSGHDIIKFRVAGTITLASTLPEVTDGQLTITGLASPGITIDGGNNPFQQVQGVQVMQVASRVTLNLNHLTIADGFNASPGGGISNDGTLNVSNSTFSGHQSVPGIFTLNEGGAIYNAGSLTVTNTTFSGNRATTAGPGQAGAGGAIFNEGTMKVTNSTFFDNFGLADGGAISNDGILTVVNSTFFENTTSTAPFPGPGAGIQNCGTLTVTNSTFSGNGGGLGGGISNGGICNGGFASLKNTILANSSGGIFTPPSNCSGTINDAGYNISDDASCGFAKTGSANNGDGVNPLLSAAGLANNGGPTETIALQSGSPAIDAIPLADCTDQASPPNPITTDQRGLLRPDTGEQVCDIGAYEFQDFAGDPGQANCYDESVRALNRQFGSLDAAASAKGYSSLRELQNAIGAFCKG